MKHTLVALLRDQPGVLNRTLSLFRRRAFNIESLSVGHSQTPGVSRMTLVIDGDVADVDQLIKQLYKLIDVLQVSDVSAEALVARELMLAKIHAPAPQRSELIQLADVFEAKVVDVAPDLMMVELSGSPDKIDSFLELLRPFGMHEMVRTGCVAMVRGTAALATSHPEWHAA